MTRREIDDKYFEWMYDLVCEGRYARGISYRKLLGYLHEVEFTYTISNDANRAEDGIDLRRRFPYGFALDGPCSVLEMMIALAIRCEESIMDDPKVGNRTGQWFWRMVTNLGLGSMSDNRFDEKLVKDVIERFLDRDYEPDGRGGLFTVCCDYDLRDVEIWIQLGWYLNGIC